VPNKPILHEFVALLLCLLLMANLTACGERNVPPPTVPLAPNVFEPLQEALAKSYEELFRISPKLEFTKAQIDRMREFQQQAKKHCSNNFQNRARDYEQQMNKAQADLRRRTRELNDAQRKELHCEIQSLRLKKNRAETLAKQAIPVAYDNRLAKLDLIELWPPELPKIQQEIKDGTYMNRPFADVKDIGFREVGKGQEDDVKKGQDAIQEMKQSGMLPPELEDETVRKYVTELAERIARKSDLRVPVKVTVLNSREVNAFALPGGFLFLQRGLLEEAEDEAQLAGVIAHEISHASARHGHRLMRKATIASIIYQAAQIAAVVLTGGVAGIGTYYALQYGFYGLGLILSLDLLGVSREFELEADQLGVQYAWNAGFDPAGFTRFFDRMATRVGYVNGASWFRTHPPFYQRMVHTQREIMFLPKKDNLIVQSTAFERMKAALENVTAKAHEDEKKRPSLLKPEEDCPPVDMKEYKPGESIESLCPLPSASSPKATGGAASK
jgi:Skp family chaperone for outer membrane proteins